MKLLRNGFTLIELLVVVAIIGILVAVLNANFNDARQTTRNKAIQAELQEVQLALELYKAQNNQYPDTINLLVSEDFIPNLPDPDDSDNDQCNYTYITNAGGYKYTAERCLGGAADETEGIQPDTELARCPSSCATCAGDTYNSTYIDSPSFYESVAIYSLGAQCE